MKILSFGEILWDVYPDKAYIGGAPLNFAAHMAKAGDEVYMLSAVGKDSLGSDALKQLDKWGISPKFVSKVDKETGKCLVTLDENFVPSYNLLNDVAYDFIDTQTVKEPFDVLYFGTLSLRSDYNFNSLKTLLESGDFKEIFVDVNIRAPFYSEKSVRFALENATVLKVSLEEMPTVASLLRIDAPGDYKAFAKKVFKAYGLKCIIITLGSKGAYAFDGESECFVNAKEVKVVSTVGAGDSFSASFLHKYLRGENIQACLNYASEVAAYVVSSYEAVPE